MDLETKFRPFIPEYIPAGQYIHPKIFSFSSVYIHPQCAYSCWSAYQYQSKILLVSIFILEYIPVGQYIHPRVYSFRSNSVSTMCIFPLVFPEFISAAQYIHPQRVYSCWLVYSSWSISCWSVYSSWIIHPVWGGGTVFQCLEQRTNSICSRALIDWQVCKPHFHFLHA